MSIFGPVDDGGAEGINGGPPSLPPPNAAAGVSIAQKRGAERERESTKRSLAVCACVSLKAEIFAQIAAEAGMPLVPHGRGGG